MINLNQLTENMRKHQSQKTRRSKNYMKKLTLSKWLFVKLQRRHNLITKPRLKGSNSLSDFQKSNLDF